MRLYEGADANARRELAKPLHAADVADLLEQLSRDERAACSSRSARIFDPETFSHLDESVREEVLDQLGPQEAGEAVARARYRRRHRRARGPRPRADAPLLDSIPPPDRALIEQGLDLPGGQRRPPDAARAGGGAGLSGPSARPSTSCAPTTDLPDDFYDLFIVDPRFKPVGVGAAVSAPCAASAASSSDRHQADRAAH